MARCPLFFTNKEEIMKEKRPMTAKQKNEAIWAYAFVAPTIIGLIVLNFYPAIDTV